MRIYINSHWLAPAVESVALHSLWSLCSCFLLLKFLPAQDRALVAVLHQLTGQLPVLQEKRKEEESVKETGTWPAGRAEDCQMLSVLKFGVKSCECWDLFFHRSS